MTFNIIESTQMQPYRVDFLSSHFLEVITFLMQSLQLSLLFLYKRIIIINIYRFYTFMI